MTGASWSAATDSLKTRRIVVNLDEDTRSITIELSLEDQAALLARTDGASAVRADGQA